MGNLVFYNRQENFPQPIPFSENMWYTKIYTSFYKKEEFLMKKVWRGLWIAAGQEKLY